MDFREDPPAPLRHVEISVSGKVHGVFFRKFTRQVAASLNLGGYVQNCSDGTVRLRAHGAAPQIEKLIEWCSKGPANAEVNKVEVTELERKKSPYIGFEIRRTI